MDWRVAAGLILLGYLLARSVCYVSEVELRQRGYAHENHHTVSDCVGFNGLCPA